MHEVIVIAHRGASGYLPEHTLAAKALAYAMGADYLEQDVVATRDDVLVVLHDIHLDRISDVATRYPNRARADGRWYVRDFDFAELEHLRLSERFDADGAAVFPGRYPVHSGVFRLHTLADELEFVAAMNAATGRQVGIYPEIKRPAWHRAHGIDIAPLLLQALGRFGYATRESPAHVQCFDPAELDRIRHELDSDLKLVQLIGENAWGEAEVDYGRLRAPAGLSRLAKTVDGIGPWLPHCYELKATVPRPSGLVAAAHGAGLVVHPYTVRADSLPPGFASHDELVAFAAMDLAVDGLFTDFPDLTRRVLGRVQSEESDANR